MSLFDVIKYPISDIPAEEELSNLPADLYTKWIMLCWEIKECIPPSIISGFFQQNRYITNLLYVDDLRKMIKELP